MNKVLKGYKSRTFVVEATKTEHPRLLRLLNERILHRLNGTYSHQDRPGVRHEIYTVDYGAYVRYRQTQNAVKEKTFWDLHDCDELTEEETKSLVPVDDKRSIRRIIFDPENLGVSVEQ